MKESQVSKSKKVGAKIMEESQVSKSKKVGALLLHVKLESMTYCLIKMTDSFLLLDMSFLLLHDSKR